MTCAVRTCTEDRSPDALVCGRHLTELWGNRLDRQDDGTFVPRVAPRPRWLRRADDPEAEGATMGLLGKDLTGAIAA